MHYYNDSYTAWNKLAELYQEKFMHLNIYNETYDSFYSLLKNKNAEILDCGCGPGNITKYLLQQNSQLKITGTDVSENMIALAKANNPSASFKVMDSRDILSLNKKFDGIVSGFCIPYLALNDCKKLIADCYTLLNPKGIFYLSFVEGDYNDSGYKAASTGDKTYFHYYNTEAISKILNENSFAIKQQFSIKYKAEETHIIIIAEK